MEREFKRELSALDEIFRFTDEFASACKLSEDLIYSVQLVVEELFTNFVRHNQGGRERIWIALDREASRLMIRLKDFDVPPFQPRISDFPSAQSPLRERKAGGLGLPLIANRVDDLRFEHANGELCVTAILHMEDACA